MNKPYTMAIIGYGGVGRFHYETISDRVPEIHVTGAWDIRSEALEKARSDGLYPYSSLAELLNDTSVDIALVATPNNFHKALSIACLRAGKTVVCEKPVTMNAAELREVIAVSKKTGKIFTVHQNRRADKDYLIIKKVLADNTVGKPYFIESRVQGSRGAMHGWRGYKVNGGGMVLDWGVHLLDQVMHLFDAPVVSVGAHLFSVFTPEVEDNIKLFLRFGNDVSVQLEMSTNCLINLPRWHMSCTDGTVVINDWDCNGKIMKLASDRAMTWEDDIVYTSAGPTRTMAPRPAHTMQELPLPDMTCDRADYHRNLAAVLSGKAELLVKPEEALRVMEVIDLVFASHEKGEFLSCHI